MNTQTSKLIYVYTGTVVLRFNPGSNFTSFIVIRLRIFVMKEDIRKLIQLHCNIVHTVFSY